MSPRRTPMGAAPAKRKLSAAEHEQRQLASVATGLYVQAPAGLRLRYRRTCRLVQKMRAVMPWLDEADLPTARGWAELEILCGYAFADLTTKGVTGTGGDPRRMLSEYRQLRQAQLAYAAQLGLSPASRMALGLGAARTNLATAMAGGRDDDVAAIEARLLPTRGHRQPDVRSPGPEAPVAVSGGPVASDWSEDTRDGDTHEVLE